MKIGSLVVIKPYPTQARHYRLLGWRILWHPNGDESTIYTVRGFNRSDGVLLEEGIIGYNDTNVEIGLRKDYVKEVQPPVSSGEIAELVEDSCCVQKSYGF